MDIERADRSNARRRKRAWVAALSSAAILGFAGVGIYFGRTAPFVDADRIWRGTVTRGDLVREVTASGELIAPDLRAVTNRSDGVVERIHVLPGELVAPDTVLVSLGNPQLETDAAKARLALSAARAAYDVARIDAANRAEDIAADLASAQADYTSTRLELEAKERLPELFAAIDIERIRLQTEQLHKRLEAQQARSKSFARYRLAEDIEARDQLAGVRAEAARAETRVADLEVRAGARGVVQEVDVQAGERLALGQAIARIVNPAHLIARVGVSQRDAGLVRLGLPVRLDVGMEMMAGRVERVDPTVENDLVNVDVALSARRPADLRPQLSVVAHIELERVRNVLIVDRPAALRAEFERIEVYRISADGRTARRVPVLVGRASERQVEIVSGLDSGDRVILSDLSDDTSAPVIAIR